LTSISVSPENAFYTSENGCNTIIEKTTKTLICSCKTTTIPSNVEVLGPYAFESLDVSSVSIPSGVKLIGERCFENSSITSIDMPDTITSVGDFAFYSCKKLASVKLSGSLTRISYYAFGSCTSLSGHFKIPSTVTSLEQKAFASCTKLTSVFVPRSITFITTGRPFDGCSSNMIIYTDITDGRMASSSIPTVDWTYDWNSYNSLGDKLVTLYGSGYYPDIITTGVYSNSDSVDKYFDKKLYVQDFSQDYSNYVNYANTYCYRWNSGIGINPLQEYVYKVYFYKVNSSSFKIFFDPEQNIAPKTFSVSSRYAITDSGTGEVYVHTISSGGGGVSPPVIGPIIPM
jgi:hypothetical protein